MFGFLGDEKPKENSTTEEPFQLPATVGSRLNQRRASVVDASALNPSMFTLEDANDMITDIKRLHSEERLMQAATVLTKLRDILSRACETKPEDDDMKAVKDYVQDASWARVVENDMAELEKYVDVFDEDEGWEEARTEDGIKTMYRYEEGLPTISVRIEGMVEASVLQVLAVFNNVKGYETWYPQIAESKRLLQISEFRSINYMKFGLPVPFSDRDLVVYAFGADLLEEQGSIVVAVRSVQTKDVADHHVTLPPVTGNDVRSSTNMSAHQFIPMAQDRTYVRIIVNADLDVPGLPYFLINFLAKQVSHRLLVGLREQCPKVDAGEFAGFARRLRSHFTKLEAPTAASWGPLPTDATDQPLQLTVDASGEDGPGKYTNIQSAVNAASPGDTVIVMPGQYHEGGCLVVTKAVSVIRDPNAEDGAQVVLNASLVYFGDAGHVKGITIKYLEGVPAPVEEGAVSPAAAGAEAGSENKERILEVRGTSEVTIEECDIAGSMMISDRSNPKVFNCKIHGSARHGLLIEGRSRGTFENNTISTCSRAGVVVRGEAEPLIRDNKISSNRREGVQVKGHARAVVERNTIQGNMLGISVRQFAAPSVVLNSIHNNVRAGITVAPSCEPRLEANDDAHNGEGEITPRGSDSDSSSDSDADDMELLTPKTPYSTYAFGEMPPRRNSLSVPAAASATASEADEGPPALPMVGKAALQCFPDKLTEREKEEIVLHGMVYFLGERHNKPDMSGEDLAHNHGFDDASGNYKLFPNDQIAFRYEIICMLGSGSFGQVVKCIDHKTGNEVAIKVICNEERRHAQARIECQILEYLERAVPQEASKMGDTATWNIVTYQGHFDYRNHLCIVFPLLGTSLYDMAASGTTLPAVQHIAVQLVRSLTMLRRLRLIHCDLKPDNILIMPGTEHDIEVIDFGTSCFEGGELYMYVQTRYYRSPCVILGIPYDCGVDMFSLGCVLAELHMGRPLFPGDNDVDQLARIMEVLGPPPMDIVNRSTKRNTFFEGTSNRPRIVPNLHGKRRRPGTRSLQALVQSSDAAFLSFLKGCLCWDPQQRLTPETAAQHEFITSYTK